jgi:ribosome-associated translation inhibitor RaiA
MAKKKVKDPLSLFKRKRKRLEQTGAERTERLIQNDPDLKSFVYQQIAEFQPYVTPSTVAAVIAKDPQKLDMEFEAKGQWRSSSQLALLHRVSIRLKDGDSSIQQEAHHENIYEAIRLAKEKLLLRLDEIQDKVVSKKDRIDEINQALQNQFKH